MSQAQKNLVIESVRMEIQSQEEVLQAAHQRLNTQRDRVMELGAGINEVNQAARLMVDLNSVYA